MSYFSLYLQTSYSLNGSLIDIERTIKKAKEMGYQTLGLTDRNKMHGAIKFYRACVNVGVKPLLGLEVLVKSEKYQDLIVLFYAKSNKGYHNLIRLSSRLALQNGFLALHEIAEYAEDLAMVVVVDRGSINQLFGQGEDDVIESLLVDLEKVASDYYLGFGCGQDQQAMYQRLKKDWKCVYVQPVLYEEAIDREASDVLNQILGNTRTNQGFFEDSEQTYHLLTKEALNQRLAMYPDVEKATIELIESCNVTIRFNERHLPSYPLSNVSAFEKLKQLTNKGLIRRLKQKKLYPDQFPRYKERLDHEMAIIKEMKYEDYFLIVWDFVLYAKKKGVLVGPGRGSAAGSLISYVLGITEVDPLVYDLYFERFLNPERITMPDIDMDFPDDKRDEVIRYVVNKYGIERVASIITFGTFLGKSAIRDVGRVLNTSAVILDDLTKKISDSNNSIEQFEKEHPDDYAYYMDIPEIHRLLTIAKKITGLVKHVSTHAAGIIIAREPITAYSPVQPGLLDMYQTQYEASDLERLGLLKIDFLGIRNLTIIQKIIDLIYENEHKSINVYKLPLDDEKTFALLKDVKTLGIFQLESDGMMNLMRQMKIRQFDEIATCISLHRPGPMENIPLFIRRRNKEELMNVLHQDLMPILESTNGIIVYQEQIMKIANQFANYSLGEADVLRRAVSKKNKDVLVKEREKFVSRVVKQGYTRALGDALYDYIVKFANYGFNKSHAVAYSYIAYWMAYLKANYPSYFLAVLLDFQIGSVVGTKKYIKESRSMGIDVLPPKINASGLRYRYEAKGLRYPFTAIKGIGSVTAERIVAIQEESEVKSFIDFCERGRDLPKNVVETLIYANVFSAFGINKQTLIQNLDKLEAFIHFHYRDDSFRFVGYDEFDYLTMESKERELLGINFEYHLIHRYDKIIQKNQLKVLSDVTDITRGNVVFVGVIAHVKVIKTKNDDEMAFVLLEDDLSQIDGVLFPKQYSRYMNQIQVQNVYRIEGKMEMRHHHPQVIIQHLQILGG